jgi:dolichol-phosphate mannosyltransferase
MIKSSFEVSVILPCLDEVTSIASLVRDICAVLPDKCEIIIVDDGSTDGTVELLRVLETNYSHLRLIQTKNRLGLGMSIQLGIQEAGGDNIIVLDSDGMHDPSYFPIMLDKARQGIDLVIGSRYAEGGMMLGAVYPHLSKVMNFTMRKISGSQVRDQLCGYFVASRTTLRCIPSENFYGFGEYFVRVIDFYERHNLQILEVPTIHRVRSGGKRKSIRRKMIISYLKTSFGVKK